MSDKIIHTGSVEFEGVSDALREELAGIFKNSQLPVVIRLGDRKCMVVLLPPDGPAELSPTSPADETRAPHKPGHGELKFALVKIVAELDMEDGETVPASRVLWITNELRRRGLVVASETVRTKLRTMGFYAERKA